LARALLRTNPQPGTTRNKVVHNAYGVKCFGLFFGEIDEADVGNFMKAG
jgi:hypothetical protein